MSTKKPNDSTLQPAMVDALVRLRALHYETVRQRIALRLVQFREPRYKAAMLHRLQGEIETVIEGQPDLTRALNTLREAIDVLDAGPIGRDSIPLTDRVRS